MKVAVIQNRLISNYFTEGPVRCERSGHPEHQRVPFWPVLGVQSAVKGAVIQNRKIEVPCIKGAVQSAVKGAVIQNT